MHPDQTTASNSWFARFIERLFRLEEDDYVASDLASARSLATDLECRLRESRELVDKFTTQKDLRPYLADEQKKFRGLIKELDEARKNVRRLEEWFDKLVRI